jgi:hypothetical protein
MKNLFKIIFTLATLALFIPQFCDAAIQVEIIKTPLSMAASLKSAYGVSAYYTCRSEMGNLCDKSAMPDYQLSCESYIQYCLEKKSIQSSRTSPLPTPDDVCHSKYGINSYSAGKNANGEYVCNCAEGYAWYTTSKDECVSYNTGCMQNFGDDAYYMGYKESGLPKCGCKKGYDFDNNKKCALLDNLCKQRHGQYSIGVDNLSSKVCGCLDNYEWNTDKTACIKKVDLTNQPVNSDSNYIGRPFSGWIGEVHPIITHTQTPAEKEFTNKLKGKILLKVEDKGEAYYVNPKDGTMYYMADGSKAYGVMKNLGVGISNKDLEKVKSDTAFAKKHSGKIFLQVEANGEAYYIDFNGNAHYLKDGAAAYEIMKNLGLGITNSDLSKILEGGL